jgi:peroxiredoxin
VGILISRTDISITQKKTIVAEMLAAIRLGEEQVRASAADDLIWYASRAGLDDASIRQAVEVLVNNARESSFPIDHEAALLIREYRLDLGRNDPSIQSRIALLQLDEALSKTYSFTLPSLDSKRVSLRDLRGQVVLLNFWATWCGPCRSEKPILEKIYRDLKHRGFMVLAITDEDPSVVQPFVDKSKLGIPVLIDRERGVFDHYGIEGIPRTVILDRQGRPTARPITVSDEDQLWKLIASARVAR